MSQPVSTQPPDKTGFPCGWANGCLSTIWTYVQWSKSRLSKQADFGQLLQFHLPDWPKSASVENVSDGGQ